MNDRGLHLLRDAIDLTAADAAILIAPDGSALHVNPLALALFGARDASGVVAGIAPHKLHEALGRAARHAGEVPLVLGPPAPGLGRIRALRAADGTIDAFLALIELAPQGGDLRHGGAMVDCAWLWDIEHGRELYSREWKQMLGLADQELGDSSAEWRARVHPDDLPAVLVAFHRACQPDRASFTVEHRLRHADGSWRWIRSSGQVVERGGDGRALRMAGVDRDVTDVHELALQVDEREAILAIAERLASVGYWTWDPQGDCVMWSAGMYRAFGLPVGSAAPSLERHAQLLSAQSFATLNAAVQRCLAYGESYSVEVDLRRPDGTAGVAIAIGEAQRNPAGRIARLWGVLYDVTAERASLRESQQQRALLERMSAMGNIGAWSYDPQAQRLEWSRQVYSIHELPVDSPVDLWAANEFYVPGSREAIADAMRRALEQGESFDLELRLRTCAGREIWVRAVGEAELAQGRATRIFGTLQDITATKQAQLRLAQALEDLRARNRELQDFAGAASHDLQEPLRKIQTFASLLSERFGSAMDAQARDWVARMAASASRMGELVGDLLAYSRVAGQAASTQPVALGAIATGVLVDLEAQVEASGARIEIGALPVLRADPMQMRQLLQNLLGNAIKYRQEGRAPRVQVSAQVLDLPSVATGVVRPHCRLEVADNGIGFEQRHAEQIFAPFQRLHERSRFEGTGMGLAIVRRIVERHGGRVWARGTPGAGAVFTVELPIEGPPERPGAGEGEDAAP
jgi:PAS domain S-box-containing protein